MIFGFSILVSLYATALVAGMAYQQVEPIVKFVPMVAKFLAALGGQVAKRWEHFTMPENRRRMASAAELLSKHQPIAEWILRKLAVRLIVGWGALASSLVVLFLIAGALAQFWLVGRSAELTSEVFYAVLFSAGLAVSVGVLSFFSIRSSGSALAVYIPTVVRDLRVRPSSIGVISFIRRVSTTKLYRERYRDLRLLSNLSNPDLQLQPDEKLVRKWMALESYGRSMVDDLADFYHVGKTLSGLSETERAFIRQYIETFSWLRQMEVLQAMTEWHKSRLKIGSPDELMDEAEEYYKQGNYDSSYLYYVEVRNLLEKDDIGFVKPEYSEAFLYLRIGECYACKEQLEQALELFEKVKDLKPDLARSICSGGFKTLNTIRTKKAFTEFCESIHRETEKNLLT